MVICVGCGGGIGVVFLFFELMVVVIEGLCGYLVWIGFG